MTICAAILSNGNETTIGDAVRSVLSLVDRVLLVDTGIGDRTREIAREIAGDQSSLTAMQWPGRFDEARNHCMDFAQTMGHDWYLLCDSDEVVSCDDPVGARQRILSSPGVDCWLVADASGTYYRERLIRLESPARWHGRTHESLIGIAPARKRILPGVTVTGRPKTPEQAQTKLERDAQLLTLETAESPADPRWWYYLGQTREDLRQYKRAVEAYRRCWWLPGWSEQSAWSCYRAAVCHCELREYDAALATCAVGLVKDARFPELAWLAGWCCYQLGRYAESEIWARMALSITDSGRCEQRIGFRFPPGWRERPQNLQKHLEGKLQ